MPPAAEAILRRLSLLLVAAAALLVLAAPAHADRIADKRREAERVDRIITASRERLEGVIQRYNLASERLEQTENAIEENHDRLDLARTNLGVAKFNLARSLVIQYKSEKRDPVALLMSSGSIAEFLDQLELYRRANEYNGRTLGAIRVYKAEVTGRRRDLIVQERKRKREFAAQQAAKHQIEDSIAANRRLLRSLKRDVRRLIAEKRQRERELAAQRAAAAARALAAWRGSSIGGVGGYVGAGSGIALPPGNSLGVQAVRVAMQFLGTPYVWGGTSPGGFDCSGLTQYAYAQVGISIPRVTYQQIRTGASVPRESLAPGDLVFFNGAHHVGMYIGGGNFVHAPHTGDVVKVSNMSSGYYAYSFIGAVRVTG